MQIDIVQIVGLGLIATFLSLIVKEQKPTFAFLIVVFAGCAIFLYLVDQIYDIIRMIEKSRLMQTSTWFMLKPF